MADVYRSLRDIPDPEQYIAHAAPWVYLANQPYLDWLFGSGGEARRIVEIWMHRDSSEISIRNISLLFRDGVPLGGLVALEGKHLVRSRKADLMAILRDVRPEARDAVLSRVKAAGQLFVYPRADEYYLAKMGVVPEARGGGVGRIIFGASLEQGAALGYRKFRGDVHVDNLPALKLYQSFGFEIEHRTRCEEAGLAYVSVGLDRTRS